MDESVTEQERRVDSVRKTTTWLRAELFLTGLRGTMGVTGAICSQCLDPLGCSSNVPGGSDQVEIEARIGHPSRSQTANAP